MAYTPTKPKSKGASGKYRTYARGEGGSFKTKTGKEYTTTPQEESSYAEITRAREEEIRKAAAEGRKLTTQQEKELAQNQEQKKEEAHIITNKEQLEEINKNINARDLSTALVEGRVIRTPEGIQVINKKTPSTPPEIQPPTQKEREQFTTPRTISPQETQPATKEINFKSPFPEKKPYPNTISAAKPEPKIGKPELPWAVKVNKAIEEAQRKFMETAETPGNEPLILLTIPAKYAYGAITEARNIGSSAYEIGKEATKRDLLGLAQLPTDILAGTTEALAEQAGRTISAITSGNVPALSEEAGRITAIYGTSKAIGKVGGKITKGVIGKIEKATPDKITKITEGSINKEYEFSTTSYDIEGRKGRITPEEYRGASLKNEPATIQDEYSKTLPTGEKIYTGKTEGRGAEIQTQITPKPRVETTKESIFAPEEYKPMEYFEYIKSLEKEGKTALIREQVQAQGQTTFNELQTKFTTITPEEVINEFRKGQGIKEAQKKLASTTESGESVMLYTIEPMTAAYLQLYEYFSKNPIGGKLRTELEITKAGTLPEQNIAAQAKYMRVTIPILPPRMKITAKPKIKSATIQEPSIIPATKPTTSMITEPQIKISSSQTQAQEQTPTSTIMMRSGQRQRIKPAQAQAQSQEQEQKQEQIILEQQQEQITKPKPFIRTPAQKEPTIKETPTPFPRMRTREEQREGTPITIKIRRRGIFQQAGQEETIIEAKRKAENIVETTAAASYKLERRGRTILDLTPKKEFGKSKREPGVMIQKREFRISTPGEKTEITQKGIFASRQKSKRNKWRKAKWEF